MNKEKALKNQGLEFREDIGKEGSVRINYIKGQQDIKSMCLGRTYQ